MEVPAAASAVASGDNESTKWPAALSRTGAVAMSATSLLFAWLAAGTLRDCGAMDDEKVFTCVLWALSPLICAYLFCWTVALSPHETNVIGAVLVRAACLLLLAAAADKLAIAPPIAGPAATLLATIYSACACGRALAEHRQRAGTERWSAAAVASTPTYQSRAEEQAERDNKVVLVCFTVLSAVVVLASLLLVFWTAPPPETEKTVAQMEWETTPTEVVFLIGPLLLIVRLIVLSELRSPILAATTDMHALVAVSCAIGWLVVAVSAAVRWGTIAGTVAFWIGELVMVGFLGYSLAVEAHYKQLIDIKRREPRRAKDASGLLDGRDNVDASWAHIDAATGLCVDCVCSGPSKCTCRS